MKNVTMELENSKIISLNALLKGMGNARHPFKMATARNLKKLSDPTENIMDGLEDLRHTHLKLNEDGVVIMKTAELQAEVIKTNKYNKDDAEYVTSMKEYDDAVKAFLETKTEVVIVQVSLEKKVTLTSSNNVELSIADILDNDDLCDLSSNAIELLMDIVLVD